MILLSNNSVKSNWVRGEWESTIWDENQNKEIRIIPILIEECEIPRFIKYRKYILEKTKLRVSEIYCIRLTD